MIDIFYLKLILAFIVGASWITGATIIAERFGSKIGGAISGIPSVIVISLFFIGWTQSASIASQSTNIVPIILGVDALFIAIYIVISKYSFYLSVATALLIWFILSLGLVFLKFNNFSLSLIGFVLLLGLSYFIVEKILKIQSSGQKKIKRTPGQLIFRALLSGSMVSLTTIMTRIGGPILGGTFASFPAIMLATIIITYLAHGRAFSAAVMKTLMISGSVNCVIYAACVRYLYPSYGIYAGTLLSFIISLITSYLTYIYINRKMT